MKLTPIAEIKQWAENPRSINREELDRLKQQMVRLGDYKPVLINKDSVLIGGNMRYLGRTELAEVNPKYAKIKTQLIEFKENENGKVNAFIDGEMVTDEKDKPIDHETEEAAMLEYALSDNDQAGEYDPVQLEELLTKTPIKLEMHRIRLGQPTKLDDLSPSFNPADEEDQGRLDEKEPVECPECGHSFVP